MLGTGRTSRVLWRVSTRRAGPLAPGSLVVSASQYNVSMFYIGMCIIATSRNQPYHHYGQRHASSHFHVNDDGQVR